MENNVNQIELKFQRFFISNFPKVKNYAQLLLKSEVDAEDIFCKLWLQPEIWLDNENELDNYLFIMTRNIILNIFKHQQIEREYQEGYLEKTVLYFEGDKMLPYRILRAAKNRYGSTNELGMFDMTGKGLEQIENPSQVMLEGRPIGISGTCVACVMEGTRPVLSEIQALVTKTAFPSPRRTASGFDYNRMYLLLAVLEKRAGYVFGNQDVYINIIGGLKLDETACDLPVCLAMASSLLDLPVPEKALAIGEVGLGGEVRSVPHLETRLREAQRVGFDTAIVPKHNLNMLDAAQFPGLRLVGVAYLREAINAIKINK